MEKEEILSIVERLVEENPGNLHSPNKYICHIGASYEAGLEVIEDAISNYPKLEHKIDKELTVLACGLHDIARPLEEDQLFHALRGAKYIEKNGLELGLANSLTDIYRVAQMIRSHCFAAEEFFDENNAQQRREFEVVDIGLLFPRTWNEKIVVYGDQSNDEGERMPFNEALKKMRQRRSPDPIMKKGIERVLRVCQRVQDLRDGKLKDYEITAYGFI